MIPEPEMYKMNIRSEMLDHKSKPIWTIGKAFYNIAYF